MGWFAIIYVVLLVVSMVLSFLLTPKPKIENARPKPLGDFNVPTATENRAVPIVWGTVDIRGPNVLWYGNLKVVGIVQKQGKGHAVVGFRYFIGMDLLLCYGPVDRITNLEISDKNYLLSDISPTLPLTPAQTGTAIVLSSRKHLGGSTRGGTVRGTIRVYSGGPGATQNAYLQSQLGTNIPAYVNVAHAVAERIEVGESTQIGNYVFRVSRFPDNLGLTGDNHIAKGTITNGDANPMEVLYEILTSDLFGLSIDPGRIDIASFVTAGNTLASEGNGMSWIITSVTPALDLISEIVRQADAVFFEDATGKFSVRLVRDDYTPGTLPLFDENNILEMNNFSRTAWTETQNHVNIGYADRNKDFQETGAMSQDLANVRIQGAEVRADFSYPGVKHSENAVAIAERELRQLSFPLAKVTFTATRDAASLIPGDVIRFSWSLLGITEMVVRIMSVELGNIANGKVKVTGAQDIFRVAETIYKDPNDTGWTRPDDEADAFAANEEKVREFPRILANLYPDDIPDPELARTWNLTHRPATQEATLDAEIFVDDGGGGGFIGGFGISEMIPFATLDADYAQATADKEVSDLLGVDSEIDFEDIGDEVDDQIAQGFNLVLIEGATQAEDEVIGFEFLIDDGDGSFTLRNVHRGLLDTQARDHSTGARVWFFAQGPSFSRNTFGDTQAINVRHTPQTTTDQLDVADATSLPITFAQRTLRPHHPANFTVNATRVPVAVDETADLDFDWEHRLNADLTVRDADDGDATGQDTEVEYDIEFLNAVTAASLRTQTLTTPAPGWLTYLYTQANLQSDTGEVGDFPLEVRLQARYAAAATQNPANLTSLQEITRQFNVDMGGATVQSIDLDGSTEYLANTSQTIRGFADTFSINVWVRGTSSAGGTQRDILHFDPSASNNNRISLVLTDDSNSSPFNVQLYNPSGTLFKDYDFGSFTVNTWTMLTITWDGTNLLVYQDGSAQTPTKNTDNAGTMTDVIRRTIVGGDTTPAASWAGQIFSPATWTTELAPAEITAIDAGTSTFNLRANSGNYVSRDTLNHLWDFRTSANIGQDYRNSTSGTSTDIDTNAANIDGTDLNAGQVP